MDPTDRQHSNRNHSNSASSTLLFNQVADTLPGVVFQLHQVPEKAPTLVFVTSQIQDFFALSPQEAIHNTSELLAKIHPDDLPKIVATFRYSAKNCKVWMAEFRFCLSANQVRWVHVKAMPELQGDGSLLWTGFLHEITEQKLLIEKLLISNLSMQNTRSDISDFVFEMDDRGTVLVTHSAFSIYMPKAEDVIAGRNIREILPATAVELLLRLVRQVDRQGEQQSDVYALEANAEKVWFEVVVLKKQATPCVFAVLIRDVTSKMDMADRLSLSHVALNAISQAIVVTDNKRIIVSVNQAFTDVTGYDASEAVGKKVRFFSTVNSPEIIQQIRSAFEEQVAFEGVLTSYRKDGASFKNELSIRPVFDKQNQLTNFVGVMRDVTERDALHQAIEESRNLLRTIIDAAPVRIYWKDKQGHYLGCNQAYACDIGLQSPTQIFGKDDTQLLPPAEAEKNRAIFEDLMQQEKARLFYEEQHIDASGRTRWVLKSKVPLKNKQNDTIGVLGLYEDITARKEEQEKLKKARKELLESSERYLDLYEFAPIGYISIDSNGMIVEANWKARALLGMKRREVGKERLSRYVATPHKKEWQSIFSSLKSMNQGGEMEFELQIAQDHDQLVDTKLTCVRVDDALSHAILRVTIADITHAKQAEVILRQKESYQRSLLDNFPFMVWLKDDESRLLTVNNEYLKCTGFTSHLDVVGKTDLEVWPAELAKSYLGDDQEVMQSKSPKTVDQLMEIGGKHVWYETYKSPVIVNDKVIGTVGFALDITRRKRAAMHDQYRTRVLELLATEHNLDVVFDSIIKGLEQLNPMMFCLIALLNSDKKTLHIVSAPSLPVFFVEALEGVKIGMGAGSIGTVAYTKRRLIVADVMTHPFWEKNRALALRAGIGSSWAEPIIAGNGDVLGTFGIYHHHTHTPSDDDITLIEQSARLISLAVERSATSSKIESLAYYDEVTSLPNRRFLLEQLKRALVINAGTKSHAALLYLDIDQFKAINDSRGYEVGDLMLVEVSSRLKKTVQAVDVVARVGGDEFVVLLENLSEHVIEAAKQAEVVADKVLKELSKPYALARQKHHSSASIGITVIGTQKADVEEILKQADIAMYQAKKSGRNTFCFFDHQMQSNISTLVTLENELRNALKNKQLHLYYQVQVDHMGQPFGAEALLRWIHPARGMVSPAQFIPLAEESGLIVPIGHWVIDAACAQIKAWQLHASTRDLTLSVNISAKQFRQTNFVEQVQACIERHGIDPMYLRLELTESMLLENVEETVEYMNALGKMGVQFSLDDFGTGYSSLQYLKRLPLYQLKIDQSFVQDLVNDSHDRTIVRTIIAMAQSMYIGVIAEGVETAEQQELLLTNGCRRYQGYFFGKPMPIHDFNARLGISE